jgi:hypothetical protein
MFYFTFICIIFIFMCILNNILTMDYIVLTVNYLCILMEFYTILIVSTSSSPSEHYSVILDSFYIQWLYDLCIGSD